VCGDSHSFRLAAGVQPRPGGEPGTGQERYADHKGDGCPDQVMSLMNAANHEMQRVRCAGQVENPCDDRQDADDRQDDGQRPPAGRTARHGCRMHLIHLLLCEMPGAALGGGPATSRRRPARWGCRAVVDPGGGRAGRAAATKGVSSGGWATMTTGAPGAASSTALAPGGSSPACGNPTAPAPRRGSSRRSRKVAAATPPASVSGPTATRVASVVGCSSMATSGTCAAQIREPASTIIEGREGGRKRESFARIRIRRWGIRAGCSLPGTSSAGAPLRRTGR
jgi:hypothetical protein